MPRPSARRRVRAAMLLAALCACLIAGVPASANAAPVAGAATADPVSGNGMWIWYVSKSHHGNPGAIAARARRSKITTVYVKSGDAGKYWSQFSPGFVASMHQRGLKVCAWVFIYGNAPLAEANVAARSVASGADCLILDVEGQYEGKYASADRFMQSLRAKIGPTYPVGLAAFPYADYHPSLPYSVFLGPGGAQYNLPQMYWKAIGTSVGRVFSHTYQYNRPYNRPIAPLGQTYANPKPKQVKKFRRLALGYQAIGVSWWSWQSTGKKQWKALKKRVRPLGSPAPLYPALKTGSKGDLVVWAQQLLNGAGQVIPVTGGFTGTTANALRNFQASRGLPATGILDAATWPTLLTVPPIYVPWGSTGTSPVRSGAPRTGRLLAPESAGLPSVRDEIPPPRKRR